jgi:hypothetical protein
MDSLIHLLSQFTPEALLLEAALFFLLLAGYAAFWILSKRRLGVIQTAVPSGVIKIYLNELIEDAERLRAQLFGILRAAGVKLSDEEMKAAMSTGLLRTAGVSSGTLNIPLAGQPNPALTGDIAAIEQQMTQQALALETLGQEKARIEQELALLKSSGGGSSAPAGEGDPALIDTLTKRIKELEDRLAEYSVIEDDLANLKRLQQENARLKAALAEKDKKAPTATAQADPLNSVALAGAPLETQSENPFGDPLAPAAAAVPPAADLAATPTSSAPMAPIPNGGKSEADLVAEFEKLLSN